MMIQILHIYTISLCICVYIYIRTYLHECFWLYRDLRFTRLPICFQGPTQNPPWHAEHVQHYAGATFCQRLVTEYSSSGGWCTCFVEEWKPNPDPCPVETNIIQRSSSWCLECTAWHCHPHVPMSHQCPHRSSHAQLLKMAHWFITNTRHPWFICRVPTPFAKAWFGP